MKIFMRFGLAAMLAAGFTGSSAQASTNVITIDVRAYIDGRDLLAIQGNTLQWQHLDNAAVGRWGGGNQPTIISTTLNGAPVVTGYNWIPTWPLPVPSEIRFAATSSNYTLNPALPSGPYTVSLDAITARDSLSIYALPATANGYALTLDFNDDPSGGPAWYEGKVTISYGVPEISTWIMMLAGFGALGLAGMRRKSAAA